MLLIDGNVVEHLGHGNLENDVHHREHPIRNRSESPCGIFGETSSQKRARTWSRGALVRWSCLVQRRAWRRAGSNGGLRVLLRSTTRAGRSEFRWRNRMRPSSNSATDGSTTMLRPFEVLDLAYIQFGLRNRCQHAQIIEPVGRDFMRREYFRARVPGLGAGLPSPGLSAVGGSHSLSIGKSAREISPIRWTNSVRQDYPRSHAWIQKKLSLRAQRGIPTLR